MAANYCRVASIAVLLLTASCGTRKSEQAKPSIIPEVVETQWTNAAAHRAAALSKAGQFSAFDLPQMRVYDADQRLVYVLRAPWSPDKIGADIDRAVATHKAIAGPSLNELLADLRTADGRPAASAVDRAGKVIVLDYWASWCVPCKVLEQSLRTWVATKPVGSVQMVKAEADIMKAMRDSGEKTYMMKKGPDGKLHQVEMT